MEPEVMDEKYNMSMADGTRDDYTCRETVEKIGMDKERENEVAEDDQSDTSDTSDTSDETISQNNNQTTENPIAAFDIKREVEEAIQKLTATDQTTNRNFSNERTGDADMRSGIKMEVEEAILKLSATDEKPNRNLSNDITREATEEENSVKEMMKGNKHKTKKRTVGNPFFNLLPEKCKSDVFVCEVCKATFSKEKKLSKHMTKIHNYVASGNAPTFIDFSKSFTGSEPLSEDREETVSGYKRKANETQDPTQDPTDGDVFDPTLAKNIKLETDPDNLPANMSPFVSLDKLFICKVCNISFSKEADLDEHTKVHVEEALSADMSPVVMLPKLFICKFCFATFTGRESFIEHSEKHQKEMAPKPQPKRFKCDLCDASFAKLCNKNTHRLVHFGLKPYECDICESKFTTSGGKAVHMMIHTGERPYKCGICHAAFNQKGNLTKHLSIHTGEKPHKCKYCEASFVNSTLLKTHSMLHTGETPFRCEICCMKFLKESSYVAHQKMHTGKKPFQCEICGASFVLRFSYTQHMKRQIHNGDNNMQYKCPYCDLELTSEQRYKNHLRKHTDPEKDYKCDECNAAFQQKATLERHRKVHSGIRPFHCGMCDAKFAQRVNLIVHERLHTGETPFKCEVCDLTYYSKSNYVVHMKLHSQSFHDNSFNNNQTSGDIGINAIKNIYKDSQFQRNMLKSQDGEKNINDEVDLPSMNMSADMSSEMMNGTNMDKNQDRETEHLKEERDTAEYGNESTGVVGNKTHGLDSENRRSVDINGDRPENSKREHNAMNLTGRPDVHYDNKDMGIKIKEEFNLETGYNRKFVVGGDDENQNHHSGEKQIEEDGNFYEN